MSVPDLEHGLSACELVYFLPAVSVGLIKIIIVPYKYSFLYTLRQSWQQCSHLSINIHKNMWKI